MSYVKLFQKIVSKDVYKQISTYANYINRNIDNSLCEEILKRITLSSDNITNSAIRNIVYQLSEKDRQDVIDKYVQERTENIIDDTLKLLNLRGDEKRQFLNDLFIKAKLRLSDTIEENNISFRIGYTAKQAKELLPHQKFVFDKAVLLINKKSSFLIQMPTGSGKTTTTSHIICRSTLINEVLNEGKFIIWLAPSIELLDQAAKSFLSTWAKYGAAEITYSIGIEANKKINDDFPKLLFLSFQLLSQWSEKIDQISKNIGIVIIDEAHRSIAKTYFEALERIKLRSNPLFIGLSATPGRTTDNVYENKLLANFFNRQLVTFNELHNYDSDIFYLRSQGILSKANFISLNTTIINDALFNKLDPKKLTLDDLAKIYVRNQIIVKPV